MQRSSSSSTSNTVPLIPGMISTHHWERTRPNFRKRQILEQMSVGKALGRDVVHGQQDNFASKLNQLRPGNQVQDDDRRGISSSAAGANDKSKAKATTGGGASSTKYRVDKTQPKWIINDRQVLRFYGYFQEKAVEFGRETLRTRRVVLCFYLSDCALSISEPRVANSGMAQGEFMRRMVALKANSCKFGPEDFRIGGEGVKLYSRVFHLVDCDDATRTFYEEALGSPLDSPRKYPDDHSAYVDEIEAIKLRLKAKTASAAESKAEGTRKFHENAQKVLRFYVSWHDPHPLYPETRRYVLHYYLSDDTIEVIEPKEQVGPHQPQHIKHQQQLVRERMGVSGGHHHFAVLISRRRVARNDLKQVPRLFEERPSGKQLLTDRDLRCGEWITILSRKFLLEDCDPFTRDYYLETHGVTQEPCELLIGSAGAKPSKWKLFQAKALPKGRTAFGLGLGPGGGGSGHQPGFSPALMQRLDAHVQDNQELSKDKFVKHSNAVALADNSLDKKQLRFRAKFHGLPKGDLNASREFTLTYFLEDDTLCVFEPRVKNSGVAGGRFLDRGRFRKCCVDSGSGRGDTKSRESQKEQSAYSAADFFVGAIVQFEFSPNQRLELVEADQQTLSYCESHPELFPFSNSKLVLELAAKALLASKSAVDLVRRECRTLDKSGRRVLTLDEFWRMLERFRLAALLNKQQLLTLAQKFAISSPEDGNNSSRNEPLRIAYDEFCDAVACHVTTLDPNAAAQQSEIWLRKLAKVPNLRNLLRKNDTKSAQVVSGDAFLRILSFYHVGLSANDLEALMARFSRNGAVEYHKLCDTVFQLPSPSSSQGAADYSLRQSKPQHRQQQEDEEDDDEFNFDQAELAQHCEPPGRDTMDYSPRRTTPQPQPTVPKLQFQASKLQLQSQQQQYSSSAALAAPRNTSEPSDSRVVAILRCVFSSRKYQLRKALRERDMDKTGMLGEEEFMDAVLAIEPTLSDDDTYTIADAYFPTNNCQLDYVQLLETAFRV